MGNGTSVMRSKAKFRGASLVTAAYKHSQEEVAWRQMEEMQQHNMSWIEVQFLKKSLDILCECRRTLMYTYVFAYYLKKNNQSDIFAVSIHTT